MQRDQKELFPEGTEQPLTLAAYQIIARRTAIYPAAHKVVYPTLGLVGEAGEVAEKVKKSIRDNAGEFVREDLARELGDVLWYVAALAGDLDYSLEEIARINLLKLRDRAARQTLQGSGDNR